MVSELNLFLDQKALIRSKGRIEKNVDLKYDVVNPLAMAKNHHLTKLLMYYVHCQSMHMGLQSTLNHLRIHGLWILKARQAVSSVISDCIVCKRYSARPQKYPGPAILPSLRAKLSVPFAHTGVDYTGHYYLRDDKGGKGKVCILIFTCFNTRAVYLEAVNSMSTAEFILAFVRFVNRYGIFRAVWGKTDHGGTLTDCSGEKSISNLAPLPRTNIPPTDVNITLPRGSRHLPTCAC